MRRLLTLGILIAGLAAFAGMPALAQAAVPSDFFGLGSDDTFAQPGDYRTTQLADQRATGFGLLRQTFDWSQIEVQPGVYDFSYYDQYVGDAARAGIRILPILFRAPAFRGGTTSGTATYPPRKYSDLGTFGAVLVKRYGPQGTFWSENPDVPKLSIRAWQIWNEPNLKAYWKRPNPKQYAQMLKAVAKPIKAADRGAKIVTAGMPESRIGVPLKRYIPGLYKAGAKRYFDILAINPYAKSAAKVMANIAKVRAIMKQFHDGAPIWGTEIGWSDSGPSSPQRVGAQGQAAEITKLVKLSVSQRRRLNLRGIVYFTWRDAPVYAGGRDFWGLHTGLLTLDGQPKPALPAAKAALTAAG